MSNRGLILRFTTLVAVVLLAVGFLVGLLSISVPALDGTLNCGSALKPSQYQADIDAQNVVAQTLGQPPVGSELIADCNSKRSSRKTETFALLAAGVIIGFGGIMAFSDKQKPPPLPEE